MKVAWFFLIGAAEPVSPAHFWRTDVAERRAGGRRAAHAARLTGCQMNEKGLRAPSPPAWNGDMRAVMQPFGV